jgi:hypothetical protein
MIHVALWIVMATTLYWVTYKFIIAMMDGIDIIVGRKPWSDL